MDNIVELPDWTECQAAVDAGTATKLQQFIFNTEPAGNEAEEEFRLGLAAAVSEATKKLQAELAQSKKCHEFEQDMRIEDEKKLAATERKLAEQQAVMRLANKAFDKTAEEYRSGYLTGGSVKTSDLRVEAWRAVANWRSEELTKLLSEAEQRGRDALMKELREQKPVAFRYKTFDLEENTHSSVWQLTKRHDEVPKLAIIEPLYANPMPAPDGYVMVPVEPTEEMLKSIDENNVAFDGSLQDGLMYIYKAMLSATKGGQHE